MLSCPEKPRAFGRQPNLLGFFLSIRVLAELLPFVPVPVPQILRILTQSRQHGAKSGANVLILVTNSVDFITFTLKKDFRIFEEEVISEYFWFAWDFFSLSFFLYHLHFL